MALFKVPFRRSFVRGNILRFVIYFFMSQYIDHFSTIRRNTNKILQITPKYHYEKKVIANNSIYINIKEILLSTSTYYAYLRPQHMTVEIQVLA